MEALSRRNNLVIRGLAETIGENPENIVLNFIQKQLKLDHTTYTIQRAHRIGKRSDRSRPLIVCFRDYVNVSEVLQHAYRLRDTNISVNQDYPAEISTARSNLWPMFKKLKLANPKGTVKLVYPAKLIVNGRVTHDEFPDWGDVMSGRRLGPIVYSRQEPTIPNPARRAPHGQHQSNATQGIDRREPLTENGQPRSEQAHISDTQETLAENGQPRSDPALHDDTRQTIRENGQPQSDLALLDDTQQMIIEDASSLVDDESDPDTGTESQSQSLLDPRYAEQTGANLNRPKT